MIEPIQGAAAAAKDHPAPQRAETPREPPGAPSPDPAEPPVPPGEAVLDVKLDGETMRLYTELRDPQTDRVLLRLPAAYRREEGGRGPATSFKA
jgi:hypothetical protein